MRFTGCSLPDEIGKNLVGEATQVFDAIAETSSRRQGQNGAGPEARPGEEREEGHAGRGGHGLKCRDEGQNRAGRADYRERLAGQERVDHAGNSRASDLEQTTGGTQSILVWYFCLLPKFL